LSVNVIIYKETRLWCQYFNAGGQGAELHITSQECFDALAAMTRNFTSSPSTFLPFDCLSFDLLHYYPVWHVEVWSLVIYFGLNSSAGHSTDFEIPVQV
jgi:hypothetical protein